MKKITFLCFPLFLFAIFSPGFVLIYAQQNESDKPDNPAQAPQTRPQLTQEKLKEKYETLVQQLSNDDFKIREAATEEIIKLGTDVLPLLEETLKTTTDQEVKMRLNLVKDKLTQKEENKPDAPEERAFPPLKLEIKPGGFISTMTVSDSTGKYTLEQAQDGKIKVIIEPKDGEKVTKEFDSMDKFKEALPEIAKKFQALGTFKLKIEPRIIPRQDEEDNDEDNNEDNENKENDKFKELEKLRKELEEKFKEGFPGIEELLKKLEKELEKDFNKEFNPLPKNQEENKQLYRSSRTDDEGNVYELIIEDGKVTAIYKPKNSDPVIKKFDSVDTFKKEWADFYNLFPNLDKELRVPENKNEKNPAEQPKQNAEQNQIEDAKFSEVTPVLRAQLLIKEGEGLIVKELTDEFSENKGFFKKAGIEKYDIIIAINAKPVTSVEMLAKEIENAGENSEIQLDIIRRGAKQVLKIIK